MERRDRSLEAYKKLIYIDSLDELEKAPALLRWSDAYMKDENFELTL
ncbi:MAG: hypothetical protein HY307_00785, partial [Arcobacter sp.]|nr:hypothetical protein [Arcobacter sp.]